MKLESIRIDKKKWKQKIEDDYLQTLNINKFDDFNIFKSIEMKD